MEVVSWEHNTITECPNCGKVIFFPEPNAFEIHELVEKHYSESEECKKAADEAMIRFEAVCGIFKSDFDA